MDRAKLYLDTAGDILVRHAQEEKTEGKNIDYGIPQMQSEAVEADMLCKLVGPEYEW